MVQCISDSLFLFRTEYFVSQLNHILFVQSSVVADLGMMSKDTMKMSKDTMKVRAHVASCAF
jgi:hypothetical protein